MEGLWSPEKHSHTEPNSSYETDLVPVLCSLTTNHNNSEDAVGDSGVYIPNRTWTRTGRTDVMNKRLLRELEPRGTDHDGECGEAISDSKV